MKKTRMPVMPTLQKVMEDNKDLAYSSPDESSNPPKSESDYIDEPTPASAGTVQALLPEAICALLVLYNARVQWNQNFWILKRNDGQRIHVAANASFDQWRQVVIVKPP